MTLARPSRAVRACAFVIAAFFGSAQALDREVSLAQLDHTSWSAREGAPTDVWAIAQTADGWLWFGAPSGLHRYDGMRFERIDLQLPAARSAAISSLYATERGDLLIGYTKGGVTVLRGGRPTHHRDLEIMGGQPVYSLAQDRAGVVWAATGDRLLRFADGRWERVGADWGYPDGFASNVYVDRLGTLWVATKDQALALHEGTHRFEAMASVDAVSEFIESPDGRVWLSSQDSLRLLSDRPRGTTPSPLPASSRASFATLFDRDGAYWTVAADGTSRIAYPERLPRPSFVTDVEKLATATDHLSTSDRQTAAEGKTLAEDREGNLWITTSRGIHRLRAVNVVSLDPGAKEPQPGFANFASDGRTLYSATRSSIAAAYANDGLWRAAGGRFVRLHADAFPSAQAVAIVPDGSLWVAAADALWRVVAERPQEDLAYPAAWRPYIVDGLALDDAGRPWLSVRGQGLFRRADAGWERNGNLVGLPREAPKCLVGAADGRLLMGYSDGTVMAVARGEVRRVLQAGEPIGQVTALSANRWLLVGGDNGLVLVRDEQARVLTPDRTGAFDGVTGIVELASGDVWLNARAGAERISTEALQAAADRADGRVAVEVYGSAEGYPGDSGAPPLYTNTIAAAGDGRIWLAGTYSLAWIDPRRLRRNPWPPVPVVRSLTTPAGRFEPASAAAASPALAAGTRSITAEYTALSYTRPESLRFRYRLLGVDEHWVEADARREASFNNLGPGRYVFEVEAVNEYGVRSREPASVSFTIPPTFTQSGLFRVLCGASLLGGAWLAVRWWLRLLVARERSRNEVRLREPERIARELHDTLLQGTQGFVWNVQGAATMLAADSPVRAMLEQALVGADRVMVEGRDRILQLRTLGLEPSDLPEALDQLGQALSQGSATRCAVRVDGEPRPLREQVADEVYQVAREAMSNAFRHARASLVDAQLVYGAEQFRLRVRDDGIGHDAATAGRAPAGRWGLTGMRERAEALGAEFEMRSQAGVGTEVELRLAAASAYA